MLIVVVFFCFTALNRLVAIDEGFYLLAGKLIENGNIPYLDFFYPQAPLFPYLQKILVWPFELNWDTGRLLAGLCTALLALILFFFVEAHYGKRWGWAALLLFSSSHLVYGWYTVIKLYSLPILFLFSAFATLNWPGEKLDSKRVFWSALLLGLAINTRLLMLGATPVFLVALLLRSFRERLSFLKLLSPLFLGLTLASLPALVLAASDWDAFWLNNMGYHNLRASVNNSLFNFGSEKWARLNSLLGFASPEGPYGVQFRLLFFAVLASIPFFLLKKQMSVMLITAFVLFVVHALPPRIHLQYFCSTVPFLIVGVIEGLNLIFQRIANINIKRVLLALLALPSAIYLYEGVIHYERYINSGELILSAKVTRTLKLDEIEKITEKLNTLVKEDEVVYALWPGFLVNSKAKAIPGMENNFGYKIAAKFSAAERARFKLMTQGEQRQVLADSEVRFAVYTKDRIPRSDLKILNNKGFSPVLETRNCILYGKVNP